MTTKALAVMTPADVLRWAADKIDAGPAIPLPPSIYSTLLREYAEYAEVRPLVGTEATRRTEYNIRFRNGSGQFIVDEDLNSYDPPTMGDIESDLLGADAHPVQRQELTWPDGSHWTGPWQKVPADGQ